MPHISFPDQGLPDLGNGYGGVAPVPSTPRCGLDLAYGPDLAPRHIKWVYVWPCGEGQENVQED